MQGAAEASGGTIATVDVMEQALVACGAARLAPVVGDRAGRLVTLLQGVLRGLERAGVTRVGGKVLGGPSRAAGTGKSSGLRGGSGVGRGTAGAK